MCGVELLFLISGFFGACVLESLVACADHRSLFFTRWDPQRRPTACELVQRLEDLLDADQQQQAKKEAFRPVNRKWNGTSSEVETVDAPSMGMSSSHSISTPTMDRKFEEAVEKLDHQGRRTLKTFVEDWLTQEDSRPPPTAVKTRVKLPGRRAKCVAQHASPVKKWLSKFLHPGRK